MGDSDRQPSPEDFGLTADQVARAPLPFVTAHRAGIFATAYALVLTAVFAAFWMATSSIPAAAFFAVVIVAAGSILLVPLIVCALCATERVERDRLCRSFPELPACTAFREAVETARSRRRAAPEPLPASRWGRLTASEQRRQLLARLEGAGLETRTSLDRDTSGWDVVAVGAGRRVVLRCWSGPGEVPASVAREMIACVADRVGDQGWVVTTAPPGRAFVRAVGSHPVEVVHPDAVRPQLTRC